MSNYSLAHNQFSPLKAPFARSLGSLYDELKEIGLKPREALFMGIVDEDGLPLLLNLKNSPYYPILIYGDAGAGKTHFLRSCLVASSLMHPPEDVQTGVITPFPDEWDDVKDTAIGIFPSYHNASYDFIYSAVGWLKTRINHIQSLVILIDHIDVLFDTWDFDAIQSFSYLLLRGAASGVWIIASLSSAADIEIQERCSKLTWTTFFGNCAGFENLCDNQFAFLEGDSWNTFSVPEC